MLQTLHKVCDKTYFCYIYFREKFRVKFITYVLTPLRDLF